MDLNDEIKIYDEDFVNFRFKQYCQMIKDRLDNHEKPHDRRYNQGFFIPTRPGKCGNIVSLSEPQPIIYRSGWEKSFCESCDSTDAIIYWASECVKILYPNPLTNKMSFYVPDFIIKYIDKSGQLKKEMIEIKPMKESKLSEAGNGYDRLMIAKNAMKWQAAINFCNKRGYKFRVLTDNSFNF